VQQSISFNDLIGEQQRRLRDGQPERLGGLEVDHQLEARRLCDWGIARIGARHNFGNVPCGAPILFAKVCPIAYGLRRGGATQYIDRIFSRTSHVQQQEASHNAEIFVKAIHAVDSIRTFYRPIAMPNKRGSQRVKKHK